MTQPLTRDLTETINALRITEAEFLFQAHRLDSRTDGSTEQERTHLADLARGYEEGARYARILMNYHEGRVQQRQQQQRAPQRGGGGGDSHIDGRGHAAPFSED